MAPKITASQAFSSFLDNGVFLIAALSAYPKTAEVLAIFAPKSIFGFENLGWLYGYGTALLVEGVLIAAKYSLPQNKTNGTAWLYNTGLLAITIALSAAAQLADSFYVKDTFAQQPPQVQFTITYGVPLLPLFIVALVAGKTVVQTMPESSPAEVAKVTPKPVAVQASRQFAEETSGVEVRRNELSAADKDEISRMSARQIKGKYGGSMRRAREWRKAAKDGEL